METKAKQERFEALSRMCLNNWHYIDRKTLTFHKEINFFTGHSGSGKSTIIDALQIVLYANTDGRGFFNKAAAEDSDRSLIEYLRGMVNIGENNESTYLRNHDFSSTVVLEFQQNDTGNRQCVGAVFDVETASNQISRYFFWHRGGLPEHGYRIEKRPMSTEELKESLVRTLEKQDYFLTSRNETFRRRLYDDFLGGLDAEKFPRLFKRAISFKMNSRLEDFVREYICMEQDIQIEDMQESVLQYGRMQKKIADTGREAAELSEIAEAYHSLEEKKREAETYEGLAGWFGLQRQKEQLEELEQKVKFHQQDLERMREALASREARHQELNGEKETCIRMIAETGYNEVKKQLQNLDQLLERMERSKEKWEAAGTGLQAWGENDMASNTVLWDIKRFVQYDIEPEQLNSLKASIRELTGAVQEEKTGLEEEVRGLRRERKQIRLELEEMHKGNKVFPREITEAKLMLYQELIRREKKAVRVSVLADLIEIKEERWRNAVEGYLGGQKLLLVVEPHYAEDAMQICRELDRQKYHKAAVLDTQRLMERDYAYQEGSLAEAVQAKEPYVVNYLNFLLGSVMKCETLSELRSHSLAVTDDCMLYRGYQLSHMNPFHYKKGACIGTESLKRRISLLKKQAVKLEQGLKPLEQQLGEYEKMLSLERLSKDSGEYMEWLADCRGAGQKRQEKEVLEKRLTSLQEKDLSQWNRKKEELEEQRQEAEREIRETVRSIGLKENLLEQEKRGCIDGARLLADLEREYGQKQDADWERQAGEIVQSQPGLSLEQLKRRYQVRQERAGEEARRLFQELTQVRSEYLKNHPNRGFGAFGQDNEDYDALLSELQVDSLEKYQRLAREQAKTAVRHLKDDFIFKIRSAIRDAMARKDELNRIISGLDFGKDKYQFIFTRNKGEDGKFYDMFMDETLEINPGRLADHMGNQMDLFTMEHEDKYGERMNELMAVFIPPVDATEQEQEEARRNMDKYADYRTYLSFDMQQIIQGEHGQIKLKLSRMLKKNSGGEGQNPLYVALLASFAQAYRIHMPMRLLLNPTIRLVVLDEAFSKMDAEKVASCIRLIRSLGFQVIISATNDKIQNYLENVDKTFVFANPNKRSISIQEFEKVEFEDLKQE